MPLTRYYIKEKRAKWHKNEYLTLGEWRLKIGWFVVFGEVGMKEYLLLALCMALIFTIWNTTYGLSGDLMKAVMCISICVAICFVWIN